MTNEKPKTRNTEPHQKHLVAHSGMFVGVSVYVLYTYMCIQYNKRWRKVKNNKIRRFFKKIKHSFAWMKLVLWRKKNRNILLAISFHCHWQCRNDELWFCFINLYYRSDALGAYRWFSDALMTIKWSGMKIETNLNFKLKFDDKAMICWQIILL